MKKAYIKEISYILPENTLDNNELSKLFPEWSNEKIKQKTGIATRHIANKDECASDLAEKAANELFSAADVKPKDIDFIILMTQSPDYILPPTACILQHKLGIPTKSGAFDINLGCSAYIYGLAVAKGLIVSGIARNILLLTADTYSKYIHDMDKSTRTLFGDAATATLISDEDGYEILEFDIGTDGSHANKLIIPAGANRIPISTKTSVEFTDEEGYTRTMQHLFMDGAGIFNFTIDVIPKTVSKTLTKNHIKQEDIDMYIFHQANMYMLTYLKKKLMLPNNKFYIDMEDIGNTVSSSIPIALKRFTASDQLVTHENIMLVGFGVGLSWGGVVVKKSKAVI